MPIRRDAENWLTRERFTDIRNYLCVFASIIFRVALTLKMSVHKCMSEFVPLTTHKYSRVHVRTSEAFRLTR